MSDESASSPSISARDPVTISCIECRRLKRKCDRKKPCNVCVKNSKICEYPSLEKKKARLTRQYVSELEEQIKSLQKELDKSRLFDVHTQITTSPQSEKTSPLGALPVRTNSTHAKDRRISHLTSASEALERQPKNASGYDWHERGQSARGHDGTASLSVEPDGDGYLGFASAATLFRILQYCAGGVSLSHLDTSIPAATLQQLRTKYQPTEMDKESCLDSYFQHYHTQYPLLHEATFRAQYNDVCPRPPRQHWEMLVNVVLGLGAFCAYQPMYVVDHYLESCIKWINVEILESGSLTLVQTFCLLSNLSQKRNKPNSGSVYLGIAVRMATGLGLHRELPLWAISPFEREVRRRVWWTVYMFDAGASVTFGRPILLPSEDADVILVANVHDRLFTPSAISTPESLTEPTIYCTLLYQSMFHLTSHPIYQRVLSSSPPSSSEVAEMDMQLVEWCNQLPKWMSATTYDGPARPSWLEFSAHKLFWRYCNIRIILHRRAFLERALTGKPLSQYDTQINADLVSILNQVDEDALSASQCIQASMDTISSIHRFFIQKPVSRLQTWYGLHFLFHASFVPLIALKMDHQSQSRGEWSKSVNDAREVLKGLATDEILAEKFLRILNSFETPDTDNNGNANALSGWSGGPGGHALGSMDSSFWTELLSNQPVMNDNHWRDNTANLAQTLVPYADLTTLNSFWPGLGD